METANTWQARSLQPLNQAVLLGMVDYLPSGQVGAYSTNYQWNKIMGTIQYPATALGSTAAATPACHTTTTTPAETGRTDPNG